MPITVVYSPTIGRPQAPHGGPETLLVVFEVDLGEDGELAVAPDTGAGSVVTSVDSAATVLSVSADEVSDEGDVLVPFPDGRGVLAALAVELGVLVFGGWGRIP